MKLGLHAYSLMLAGGVRTDYQPVGRGNLPPEQLLDKAEHYKFTAVQFAQQNIPGFPDWDMVTLVNLRHQAESLGLTLHLSTNVLRGEHLATMIRHASILDAPQVTVGLSHLKGNVQQRQTILENLLHELDVAIKTAERYKVMLAIENGRHTASADLAAFVHAAQSEWVGVCFDMGNPLTVPENPVESAKILAPYCKSVHLKDWQIFRTTEGAMLVNCPIGEGVLELADILPELKLDKSDAVVFLQTVAERILVPVLDDTFLQQYPRITARSLAGLLCRGIKLYDETSMRFPHERKDPEGDILEWEEKRLRRSLKQAQKLMGMDSLSLLADEVADVQETVGSKALRAPSKRKASEANTPQQKSERLKRNLKQAQKPEESESLTLPNTISERARNLATSKGKGKSTKTRIRLSD